MRGAGYSTIPVLKQVACYEPATWQMTVGNCVQLDTTRRARVFLRESILSCSLVRQQLLAVFIVTEEINLIGIHFLVTNLNETLREHLT